MQRDAESMTALAYHLVRVADELDDVTTAVESAGWGVDNHPPTVLRETASALRGSAMRVAMSLLGDRAAALLRELEAALPRAAAQSRPVLPADETSP